VKPHPGQLKTGQPSPPQASQGHPRLPCATPRQPWLAEASRGLVNKDMVVSFNQHKLCTVQDNPCYFPAKCKQTPPPDARQSQPRSLGEASPFCSIPRSPGQAGPAHQVRSTQTWYSLSTNTSSAQSRTICVTFQLSASKTRHLMPDQTSPG
jgi:hypothetical protein